MEISQKIHQRLQLIAAILLRSFIFAIVAMVFVWVVVLIAREPICDLHLSMFGLSSHEFDLFLYGFLTFIKCLNVVFFLFPYIAIRHVLHYAKIVQ